MCLGAGVSLPSYLLCLCRPTRCILTSLSIWWRHQVCLHGLWLCVLYFTDFVWTLGRKVVFLSPMKSWCGSVGRSMCGEEPPRAQRGWTQGLLPMTWEGFRREGQGLQRHSPKPSITRHFRETQGHGIYYSEYWSWRDGNPIVSEERDFSVNILFIPTHPVSSS